MALKEGNKTVKCVLCVYLNQIYSCSLSLLFSIPSRCLVLVSKKLLKLIYVDSTTFLLPLSEIGFRTRLFVIFFEVHEGIFRKKTSNSIVFFFKKAPFGILCPLSPELIFWVMTSRGLGRQVPRFQRNLQHHFGNFVNLLLEKLIQGVHKNSGIYSSGYME
jgi:hypothetical protein